MKRKSILRHIQERVMSLQNSKKRVSIRTKIFIGVGLFVILNIIINILIVKISSNDIYLGLEKRELRKEYNLIVKNLKNEEKLMDVIYDASDNGIKIKILDSNFNLQYTIFNDRLSGQFTDLDLMLLNALGNEESKLITLKNYKKSGYDLHLVGNVNGNYVILSSSIESIKKDAKTTTIILLLSSFLTLIILIFVSYFISKLFSKKINDVKEVTDGITKLNFNKKLEITSNDELGDLLKNINSMSDTLQKSINDLENANVKLKQDLLEKEKQEKLRKQLIANISHEFKTPLTIISGYSQLMLEDIKGKENKENVRMIISESERLSELVHEFLELSRLESGSIKINKTKVNASELINKELKKLSVKMEDKNINVITKYNYKQNIMVDSKQISRVVENILTNAIKFCKNENKIVIKTYCEKDYFVYEVFNSGDNILDKDLDNIFNSYYKDKSTRNKEGTGLGLTIVKAIVDLHDGNCIVKNVKNGVKFIIKIKA